MIANCCSVTKSCLTLCDHASLSVGFPRQGYWFGLPFPSPGDLPDPGIKPVTPALAGGLFTTEPPGKPYVFFSMLNPLVVSHKVSDPIPKVLSINLCKNNVITNEV